MQSPEWLEEIAIPRLVGGVRRFPPPGEESDYRQLEEFIVRRQNIWHNSRRKLAECGPRLGVDVMR